MNNLETKTSWENEYPLNTFTGETKRELVALIKQTLADRDREIEKIVRENIIWQLNDEKERNYYEENLSSLISKEEL